MICLSVYIPVMEANLEPGLAWMVIATEDQYNLLQNTIDVFDYTRIKVNNMLAYHEESWD